MISEEYSGTELGCYRWSSSFSDAIEGLPRCCGVDMVSWYLDLARWSLCYSFQQRLQKVLDGGKYVHWHAKFGDLWLEYILKRRRTSVESGSWSNIADFDTHTNGGPQFRPAHCQSICGAISHISSTQGQYEGDPE